MTKTQNYNLNQWESTDPIRREDFNADNAAVDAALGELAAANPWVRLLDMTLTEATNQIDLDVSGIDLTQFQKLELHLSGKTNYTYCSVNLRVNGLKSNYYQYYPTTTYDGRGELVSVTIGTSICGAQFELYFFDEQVVASSISCAIVGDSVNSGTARGSISRDVLKTKDITTINLATGDTTYQMQKGTRVILTGLRK